MSDSEAGKSSQSMARKQRTRFPKVKTGCRTCRIRRVKCDESKPECLRCVKFGGLAFCDGYIDQQRDRGSSNEGPLAPWAPVFIESEEVSEHLRFFTGQTAPELGGVFGSGFWSRLVLQIGQRHPSIQSAIITIGALSKIVKISGVRAYDSMTFRNGMTEDELALHRRFSFAFKHYHDFIRGIRAYLMSQEDDQRLILISCLLIACIEELQNHHQSALAQARSGLEIMRQWLCRHTRTGKLDGSVLVERGMAMASILGFSSPNPNIIEDEIVEQYRILELCECDWTGSLPTDTSNLIMERNFRKEEEFALSIMPPAFADLQNARLHLELILRRGYRFIRETQGATDHVKPVSTTFFLDERNFFIEEGESPGVSLLTLEDFEEEQRIHIAENQKWANAFQHLSRHLNKSLSDTHQHLLCTSLLKIRSTALSIRLAAAASASEMIYDQYLPEFQRIVTIARNMLESSQKFAEGSFCFAQGFIQELALVAARCRDSTVRREALEILESRDWREGTSGSRRVGDGIRFLMETEEEAAGGNLIPESARARMVRIEVDACLRKAYIQAVQGTGANAVVKSSVRDWSAFY